MELVNKKQVLLNEAEKEVFTLARNLGEKLYQDMVNTLCRSVEEIEKMHKVQINRQIVEAGLFRTNAFFTTLLLFNVNAASSKKPGMKLLHRLLSKETIAMFKHVKEKTDENTPTH